MSKLLVSFVLVAATAGVATAGSIRVENHDSKSYTVELKCSGSSKSIEIRASTTTTYTFHSTSKSCDIVGGGITFPVKQMEDGQKWKISGGKAIKN